MELHAPGAKLPSVFCEPPVVVPGNDRSPRLPKPANQNPDASRGIYAESNEAVYDRGNASRAIILVFADGRYEMQRFGAPSNPLSRRPSFGTLYCGRLNGELLAGVGEIGFIQVQTRWVIADGVPTSSVETLNKDGFLNFHQPRVFRRPVFAETCRRLLEAVGHREGLGWLATRFTPFSGYRSCFSPGCLSRTDD